MRPYRILAPAGLLVTLSCVGAPDESEDVHTVTSEISTGEIFGGSLADKQLALTFDDGPGDRTIELSAWLKGRGIKATFFINGVSVAGRQSALAAGTADGHLLANHTQTHASLTSLGASQIVSEISQVERCSRRTSRRTASCSARRTSTGAPPSTARSTRPR